MSQKQWQLVVIGLALLGGIVSGRFAPLASAAGAPGMSEPSASGQSSGFRRGGPNGFLTVLQHKVGLTPEQLDGVRGLLTEQRQEMTTIREKTDGKIRSLLTAEQQPKFDAMLAELKSRRTRAS